MSSPEFVSLVDAPRGKKFVLIHYETLYFTITTECKTVSCENFCGTVSEYCLSYRLSITLQIFSAGGRGCPRKASSLRQTQVGSHVKAAGRGYLRGNRNALAVG